MGKTARSIRQDEVDDKRRRRNRLKLRKELDKAAKEVKSKQMGQNSKEVSIKRIAKALMKTKEAEESRKSAKQVLQKLILKKAETDDD